MSPMIFTSLWPPNMKMLGVQNLGLPEGLCSADTTPSQRGLMGRGRGGDTTYSTPQ